MPITLKQMRYAIAIEEEGHFGRAAKICHVTQPALSQQINLLEDICGATIFNRAKKPISPTPFGREFLAKAKKILLDTNNLIAFSLSQNGRPHHPVRFGLIPTIAPYLLPDIFPLLQKNLNEVEFSISEAKTDQLISDLENGAIDIALIATKLPKNSPLFSTEILEDKFILATSKNRKIQTKPISLSNYSSEQILLLNEGHCLRDQTISACKMENSNTFAATSLSTIMEFVANDQGVTLLPSISIKKEASDPRIMLLPLNDKNAGRTLNLIWHQATPFNDLFNKIATLVKQAGKIRLAENSAIK
jgi:LysR family hydrogen peroxide-inducible transcriptional activator